VKIQAADRPKDLKLGRNFDFGHYGLEENHLLFFRKE